MSANMGESIPPRMWVELGECILTPTAMRFAPLTLASLVMASVVRIHTPNCTHASLLWFGMPGLWVGIG